MNINNLCNNLPTAPLKSAGTILVTGASGYIGGRLVPELIERGYKVRIIVRSHPERYKEQWPPVDVAIADALDYGSLSAALKDVDTAYYLIHSLLLGPRQFHEADVLAAGNFQRAAEKRKLKRIIYLGGLGDVNSELSHHLRSRIQVAEELRKGKVPVTILRAAIIIGSGSASYEILHHIVKKLSVIPIPGWLNNRCQPISIRDVIKYLVGCLEKKETAGRAFDIGGEDIMTYREMAEKMAVVIGGKVKFISVPFLNIAIASYAISLVTPVPVPFVRCLMESVKNEVICLDDSIKKIIPFKTLPFPEALSKAILSERNDMIPTRWSDAYPKNSHQAVKLHELQGMPRYTTTYAISTVKKEASLFQSVCRIGGKTGWFNTNWMWRLRGKVDEMLLGVGLSRGRKSSTNLKINDVVDFWRVEDIKKNRRLLLRAEMKLPGRAWLEFEINPGTDKNTLAVSAHYDTDTLPGKLYWYAFLPFHHFIFKDLIKEIDRRS